MPTALTLASRASQRIRRLTGRVVAAVLVLGLVHAAEARTAADQRHVALALKNSSVIPRWITQGRLYKQLQARFTVQAPPIEPAPYQAPWGSISQTIESAVAMWTELAEGTSMSVPGMLTPEQARAARVAFAEYANYVEKLKLGRSTSKMSPQQLGRLDQELVDRAAAHLSGMRIPFEVQYSPAEELTRIVISPKGKNALSALARRTGLELVFSPVELRGWGKEYLGAAYVGEGNKLLLGIEWVLSGGASQSVPNRIRMTHELSHAHNDKNRKRGVPSSLYGYARAETADLPTIFDPFYSKFQSIDEMDAYSKSVALELSNAQRLLKTHSRDAAPDGWVFRIALPSMLGPAVSTSKRNITMATDALQVVAQKTATFEVDAGTVTAAVRLPRDGSQGAYVLHVPLVASQGTHDPANRELLVKQLNWMRSSAKSHLAVFRVAANLHGKLRSEAISAEDKQLLIGSLQAVFAAKREAIKTPDSAPLEVQQAEQIFNRELKRLQAAVHAKRS